jgi:anthranilate phosphoribosyltransferase
MAEVLGNLGSERVWVAHGEGGFDEITPAGTSWVAEFRDGAVRTFEITPEMAGVQRHAAADLKGGDAAHNAEALRTVLDGKPSAFADAALMTAGAALVVAEAAGDLEEGVAIARKAVASGAARRALDRLVSVSN